MFDWRKLKGEEIFELKCLIEKFKGYERIDIFIDFVLTKLGVSKEEFNNRNIEYKKEVLKFETIPQSILFCDGSKCDLQIFKNH